MPYSLSHVSAVVPLRGAKLSFLAMVIGSISPDFSYFQELFIPSTNVHNLVGLLVYCVPITLAYYFLFTRIAERKLRRVFPWLGTSSEEAAIGVFAGAVIGAGSHILWDGFTHSTGYFVEIFPVLKSQFYEVKIYKLLQHFSSLFGMVAVVVVMIRHAGGLSSLIGDTAKFKRLVCVWFVLGASLLVLATMLFQNSFSLFTFLIVTTFAVPIAVVLWAGVFEIERAKRS